MTQADLKDTIISALNEEPAGIALLVEKVSKKPGVERREARAAVERLVERGDLTLDLDMRLEAAR